MEEPGKNASIVWVCWALYFGWRLLITCVDLNSVKIGNSLKCGGWLMPCGWLVVEAFMKQKLLQRNTGLAVVAHGCSDFQLLVRFDSHAVGDIWWIWLCAMWMHNLWKWVSSVFSLLEAGVHGIALSALFWREPLHSCGCWQEPRQGLSEHRKAAKDNVGRVNANSGMSWVKQANLIQAYCILEQAECQLAYGLPSRL